MVGASSAHSREEHLSLRNSYPRGWYALAFSHEVRPKEVTAIRFVGREYVLWRTAAGKVAAMEPYCPHLGTHLAHGGDVVGDTIRCPMHHFRFKTDGACAAAGYGPQHPPRSRARTLQVEEHSGFIFTRFDPQGSEENWTLPALSGPEWRPTAHLQLRVPTDVLEIASNALALGAGHAGWTRRLEPCSSQVLEARSHFRCPETVFGPSPRELEVELSITLHGLGLCVIDAVTGPGDVQTRTIFAATPISPHEVELRVELGIKAVPGQAAEGALVRLAPRQLQRWIVAQLSRVGASPACAELQTWALGFYPPRQAHQLEVLPESAEQDCASGGCGGVTPGLS